MEAQKHNKGDFTWSVYSRSQNEYRNIWAIPGSILLLKSTIETLEKNVKDLPEECHWRRQCFYCWLWACIWFAENMEMYLHTGNYSYIPTMHRVKKISEFGVFSGPCFLVFLLGTGKYGPEKTLYSENFQAVINL